MHIVRRTKKEIYARTKALKMDLESLGEAGGALVFLVQLKEARNILYRDDSVVMSY